MKKIRMRWGESTSVLLLLAIQAILLAYSATTHSPTELEPAFLASGVRHWQTGSFELYRVNPPLVRMVAALPVMAAGCRTDWSRFSPSPIIRSEFGVGSDFISINGPDSIRLMIFARWACIPFSLIGAWFAYRWSRELYGNAAGLVTLVLYVFEPNLLAHGELITPDAACTSLGVVAGYTFWRWLKRPSWGRAMLSGLCLGLAELTKLSWLVLFLLWPLIWLAWRYIFSNDASRCRLPSGPATTLSLGPSPEESPTAQARRSRCSTQIAQLAGMLFLAVYVINLGYVFDGTGTALGDFEFFSSALSGQETSGQPGNRFSKTFAGHILIPFPKSYVQGIDLQKKDFENYPKNSFLNGEWSKGGWWYYYLYGLLIKVPCGILALFAFVIICRVLRREHVADLRDELVLLTPAIGLMVLVSSQTEFSIHLRYSYPCIGFLLIFTGQCFFLLTAFLRSVEMTLGIPSKSADSIKRNRSRLAAKASSLVIGSLMIYSVISLFAVYPYHLAYFNDFIGGPDRGYHHLLGSSFDWGQGLRSAHRLMQRNPEYIGYFSAEDCASARSMNLELRLPSHREFQGAHQYSVRPPALISPNVLKSSGAMVGTAGHETEPVKIHIPPDCSIRADDGFLRVIRKSP